MGVRLSGARRAVALEQGPARSQAGAAPQSLSELSSPVRIVRSVLEGLYQGRYVPGQRLTEVDLTREFKVSRGSIREALHRLETVGVIALTRNRSAHIRALTRTESRDALAIVEVIIGLAARLAADHIETPGSRGLLESCLSRLLDGTDRSDLLSFVKARNSFYRALVKIGGNLELARMLPGMQVHLLRVQFRRFLTLEDEMRNNDYQSIATAVLDGKGGVAERQARRHIRNVQAQILALPDEAFARQP